MVTRSLAPHPPHRPPSCVPSSGTRPSRVRMSSHSRKASGGAKGSINQHQRSETVPPFEQLSRLHRRVPMRYSRTRSSLRTTGIAMGLDRWAERSSAAPPDV